MHCGNFSLTPRLLGGALLAASACASGAEPTSPITSMLDSMALGALYRADVMSNVSGGIKRDTSALGNLDLTAEIDLARLAGWTGVTAGLHGIWSHGGKPNTYLVGSMQGVDNIEVETNTAKIFQAWIEKQWRDDSFSARFGLYDLNSEFYSTRTSGIFMHPAPGIGSEMAQAGANGPSVFPTSSLALRLRYRPSSETYIQAAVLDGVPGDPGNPRGTQIQFNDGDGTLRVAEIGFTPQLAAADGATHLSTTAKYALGVWGFTSRFADLTAVDGSGNPLMRNDNSGFYLLAERTLFCANNGGHANGFIRYGRSNADINPLSAYGEIGVVFDGFIDSRPDDALGLSWTYGKVGSQYRSITPGTERHEAALEITWRAPVNDWFTIQPNLQYVIHPGADTAIENATVLGIRFEFALTR